MFVFGEDSSSVTSYSIWKGTAFPSSASRALGVRWTLDGPAGQDGVRWQMRSDRSISGSVSHAFLLI